jgi:hypothetical protein
MVVPALNNSANTSEQKARFFGGFLFLGLCATGAWFAHDAWKNQSLVLMFGTFAGVALICLLYVLAVSAVIWIRIRRVGDLPALEALCGEKIAMEFLMPISLALIAKPSVSWYLLKNGRQILSPIEVETEGGREMVTFHRRCHIDFCKPTEFSLKRKVFVSDPLGMFVLAVVSSVRISEIFVKPAEFEGPSPSRLRSIAETVGAKASASGVPQGDRVEMREYQEGDSTRLILWKVLAKTGGQRKMVRTEERVESQRSAMYLFASGPEDERAASFVKHYLRQKQLAGDWVFGVSGDEGIFCRSNGSAAMGKAIRAISRSGIEGFEVKKMDDAFEKKMIADFEKFRSETRRLRIENPVAIVGGNRGGDDSLCELIRKKAPRCGILVVPSKDGSPFFWKGQS